MLSEKTREYQRRYYKKWAKLNRERLVEYNRKYRRNNPKLTEYSRNYAKKWRDSHPEQFKAYYTSYRQNPEVHKKIMARNAVYRAIKMGRLVKQPCLVCGKSAEAHHADYEKRFDVTWLCKKHHTEIHAK